MAPQHAEKPAGAARPLQVALPASTAGAGVVVDGGSTAITDNFHLKFFNASTAGGRAVAVTLNNADAAARESLADG